jgi:DNA-binding transcriptional regulator YiaG
VAPCAASGLALGEDVAAVSDVTRQEVGESGDRRRGDDAPPDDPVETWPFEGILAAVRLAHSFGTTELLEEVVERARSRAAEAEHSEVAAEISSLLADSGLSQAEFAARARTSRSRLSTYISGQVVPSASLMVRMRRAAGPRSTPDKRRSPGGGGRPA